MKNRVAPETEEAVEADRGLYEELNDFLDVVGDLKDQDSMLELARQLCDVSRVCKFMGYSRDSFFFRLISCSAASPPFS